MMKDTVRQYLDISNRKMSGQKRLAAVLLFLSLAVALSVAWALHQTGQSLTAEAYCGKEEHTHSESCVQKALICGYDAAPAEASGDETSAAADSAGEKQRVLTCTLEESAEHTHTDECYKIERVLTCTLEESAGHSHTDDCFTIEKAQTDAPETEDAPSESAAPAHVHTDECYETTYICGKEEHTHGPDCYPNPNADTETEDVWKKTFDSVKLTGRFGADVAAIAKTQLDYTESAANYTVVTAENGAELKKGYTRYGAWYGDAYGDWCAMFASFCIYYADVQYESGDKFPLASNCQEWINTLSLPEYDSFALPEAWTPAVGDLVFFDTDGDDTADHVGIVTALTFDVQELTGADDDPAADGIKTIEGNFIDAVAEQSYELTDGRIMGYGLLPEGTDNTEIYSEGEKDVPEDGEKLTKTASCGDYTVTVSYDESAGIPEDAELVVEEVENNGDPVELEQLITTAGEAESALSGEEAGADAADGSSEQDSEEQKAAVKTTSLFQLKISFLLNGQEIEPAEGSVIDVRIAVNGGLNMPDGAKLGIVHYKNDSSVELIQDVETSGEGGTESISFGMDSFSAIQVICRTETANNTKSNGYVSNLTVSITADGTASFTPSEGNTDGKDENGNNGVVRTFDSVEYGLSATFNSIDKKTYDSATLHFEMSMEEDLTEASFDLSKMSWLGDNWEIEYLDADDKVVGYRDSSCGEGEFYTDSEKTTKTSINDVASGSNDKDPYSTNVVKQRLTGSMALKPTGTNNAVIPGTQTLTAGLKVLNAKNKSTIAPYFKVWLDDNTGNTHPESESAEYEVTAAPVTVSAGALYNMAIDDNTTLAHIGWFDFSESKGQEVTEDSTYTVDGEEVNNVYALLEALGTLKENWGKSDPSTYTNDVNSETIANLLNGKPLTDYKSTFSNIRYGRIYGYGISLQLANDESGQYGMKGLSLPKGQIELDLKIYTTLNSSNTTDANHYAVLWDYNKGVWRGGEYNKGELKRNIKWNNNNNTTYPNLAAPYFSLPKNNATFKSYNSCYNTGTWTLASINDNKNTTSADSKDGLTYHFTVNNYKFNLNEYIFPDRKVGSAQADGIYNVYEYPFSSGYVEVLSVLPRTSVGTENTYLHLAAGNLNITSTSNVNLTRDNQPTGNRGGTIWYDYEQNPTAKDNTITTDAVAYKPGIATKQNSFTTREGTSVAIGFLGQTGESDVTFWTKSSDATAYVDSPIAINGNLYLRDFDIGICAYNYLQLFDKNLEIDEAKNIGTGKSARWISYEDAATTNADRITVIFKSGTCESVEIFYVADTAYQQGYDTNSAKDMAYMNSVTEDTSTLVFYDSLDAIPNGYTCVGVLAKVRGVSGVNDGYEGFCGLRIPVKVKDDPALVGKTVATVNSVKIWNKSEIDKNPDFNLHNGMSSTFLNYVKTEYENGNIVDDTHKGGYISGSSLLILGYKAQIGVNSTKENGEDEKSYNLNNESGVVTYTLDSYTIIDDNFAAKGNATTDLTINLSLTAAEDNETIESPDVNLLPDSYSMTLDDGTEYTLSNGQTEIKIEYNKVEYTMEVSVSPATDGKSAVIYISGAPVGATLPKITAKAQLGMSMPNNSKVTATATISGSGDGRAYEVINGNMSTDTVSVSVLTSTTLTKKVSKNLIELNGDITYTVSYTNSSKNASLIGKLYLYDIIPYNGDGRGTNITGADGLTKIGLTVTDANGNTVTDHNVKATVYYSTKTGAELKSQIEGFSGADEKTSGTKIEEMLGQDGSFTKLEGLKINDAEKDLSEINEKNNITCVYVVAEGLGAGQSLKLTLTMDTNNNKAANLYVNQAHAYAPDMGGVLNSSIVQTRVVSRSISGVVWYDADMNGVRDDGEKLLDVVTCTLFKLGDDGKYKQCTENVTDALVNPINTNENGEYKFENLTDGKYVVAFTLPDKYKDSVNGATVYQVNKANDSETNDGVALGTTPGVLDKEGIDFAGIAGYDYAIAYDLTGKYMPLHTLAEYSSGSYLSSYQESYVHQDLGLTYSVDYTLPETGGSGTALYVLCGTLLTALPVIYLCVTGKRRKSGSD